MTPEEKIAIMTKAINEAIRVMEHAFESSPETVAKALKGLKNSVADQPALKAV
ncbi:MAG: hypothetical protein WAO55_07800 [Candidatus Manganitrophaceae bacterium]